jgi:hypothetical protein
MGVCINVCIEKILLTDDEEDALGWTERKAISMNKYLYSYIHTYIHTYTRSIRALTDDEEDALGWTERKAIAAKLIALCAMDGSGWKVVLPALKVINTCLCVYIKSSVMAVLGCNGLRCVIKIILSLSLSLCIYTHEHIQCCFELISWCAMDGSGWKVVLPALKVLYNICVYTSSHQ